MSQEDLCEREPHSILEGATHRVTSPSSKLRAESAQRKCILKFKYFIVAKCILELEA